MDLPNELRRLLARARREPGRVVALTGAGVSAESGIPTFRGPEGYWTIGSSHYRPEQLATWAAFERLPEEVWSWYLYRRSACRAAAPNAAHRALSDLDASLGDAFRLVTQNVDGLHLRAGNPAERTYQVHGNLDFVRCAAGCGPELRPFPEGLDATWDRGRRIGDAERARLRCEACGGWLRPHVLWFDECYDERRYRFESSLRAADAASLLLVVGTSGSTNLPVAMCEQVHRRGAAMVVVNRERCRFSELAARSDAGFCARGDAGAWLPSIVACLRELS